MIQLIQKLRFRVSTASSIIVKFQDLKDQKNLETVIEQAYGPKGLGILFVEGIPTYAETRNATLPLFSKLARLPKDILKKYERPQIFHAQGWSCGVQQFKGKYDVSKGSYYVNCASDEPQKINPEDQKHFTAQEKKMYVSNKWVDQIPEIEKNVKALSKIMMSVGALLALQIDSYAGKHVQNYKPKHLHRIITEGSNHIGRMLHYFPFEAKGQSVDDWCGWHNDHGSLTALTSALFTDESGNNVSQSVTSGGLYAKNRFAEMARIVIPKDMLAFQIGESSQIHSGGYLEATPHCVVRSDELAGKKIGRNTFALFMEPNALEKMSVPEGVNPNDIKDKKAYSIPALKDRWDNDIFFKEFHHRTMKYYS